MNIATFKPSPLPAEYRWLLKEPALPKVIQNALKFHGLREIPGPAHEAVILEMGDFLGGQVAAWHKDDETAWCGVFVGYILKVSGFVPPSGFDVVRARSYQAWGNVPQAPAAPALGDILSFWRGSPGGSDGHVGFYIGETATTYKVLGGNQGNAVGFTDLKKNRLLAARRCPWKVAQPAGVRPVIFNAAGPISRNEA